MGTDAAGAGSRPTVWLVVLRLGAVHFRHSRGWVRLGGPRLGEAPPVIVPRSIAALAQAQGQGQGQRQAIPPFMPQHLMHAQSQLMQPGMAGSPGMGHGHGHGHGHWQGRVVARGPSPSKVLPGGPGPSGAQGYPQYGGGWGVGAGMAPMAIGAQERGMPPVHGRQQQTVPQTMVLDALRRAVQPHELQALAARAQESNQWAVRSGLGDKRAREHAGSEQAQGKRRRL